jgi:hypothetical protein
LSDKAEDEGLEPPRDCSRRISSAVPYQLGLVLHEPKIDTENRHGNAKRNFATEIRYEFSVTPFRYASLLRCSVATFCQKSGKQDLNLRPLRPERSALPG